MVFTKKVSDSQILAAIPANKEISISELCCRVGLSRAALMTSREKKPCRLDDLVAAGLIEMYRIEAGSGAGYQWRVKRINTTEAKIKTE
jgi:DNA-binding transcriptional ArsR family regulator